MWKQVPAVLLLLLSSAASAQTSSKTAADRARILTLESAWNQAIQQKDASALTLLLSPDMVYVEYDGSLMNKSQYLADVQTPILHYARLVNEELIVYLYGDAAIVTGVCHESGTRNGKPYALRSRFTDTWIRRGDSWMSVASQSTLMSP